MRLERFDPPANVQDFRTDAQRRSWSRTVAGFFNSAIQAVRSTGVQSQFYNPLETDTDDPFSEATIEWTGFPKLVRDRNAGNLRAAFQEAEPTQAEPERRRRFQDEYLEWNVVRNQAGLITRVSFTSEGPEYWRFLAATDPQQLLALYRSLVDPALADQVQLQDLMPNNTYNQRSRWNTLHGAIHLTQPNNTLAAEVRIAADATVLRDAGSGPIPDPDELTECGGFGAPGRASDPRIGIVVQGLARRGLAITLKNPVGLYITSFHSGGLTKPDGTPAGDYWRIVRGTPSPGAGQPANILHLVYEVPAGEGFVAGEMRANGVPLEFGGQLAERIQVGLVGVACREGSFNNPALGCVAGFAPSFDAVALEALGDQAPISLGRAGQDLGEAELVIEEARK